MAQSNPACRIAINGYGRIGQCVLRALYESGLRAELQLVAINELSDIETIAYLTRYDSTHGPFCGRVETAGRGRVETAGDQLLVAPGKAGDFDRIQVLREADPAKLPWRELGVDLLLECSGAFSDRATANSHLQAGAKRLLFSQPAGADVDKTIVFGVNQSALTPADTIVSNASCTTNCIVPVIQVLDTAFGIEFGAITTIHAAMNDQPVIDAYHHQDLRRTRSALHNIVPVETGLARGIERLLPHLANRFSAVAMRVPTINVSAIDMTVSLRQPVDVARVNRLLAEAAQGSLRHIMGYTEEPLASSDFNHDPRSVIVDGSHTRVSGDRLVKVLCWFDNEWGFANRMLDVSRYWLKVV